MADSKFLVVRTNADGTIPYRGLVASYDNRVSAFEHRDRLQKNPSTAKLPEGSGYTIVRAFKARTPNSAEFATITN